MDKELHRCGNCGGWNRVSAEKAAAAGTQAVCGRCKEPLDTSGAPQDVDDAALAAAIASAPVPVVVDFWAPWCGPCKMMAPVLDAAGRAADFRGKVSFLKLNSDDHPASSAQHGVKGIPTLVLFRNGAEAARQVGALPRPALEAWLRSAT